MIRKRKDNSGWIVIGALVVFAILFVIFAL